MAKAKEIYETEEGVELTLVPVRSVLVQAAALKVEDEFRARGEPVDPPTYQFKDVSGALMEVPHSVEGERNTLDDPDDPQATARNWAGWNRYQDCLMRLALAQEERRIKVLYMLGIECEIPDGWEETLEVAGIEVPEKPLERKFAYLWYIATSTYDKQAIRGQMEMLSLGKVVSKDQRDLFQQTLQSAMEKRAGEIFGTALARVESVGPLVPDAEARGDEDGGEVAEDA